MSLNSNRTRSLNPNPIRTLNPNPSLKSIPTIFTLANNFFKQSNTVTDASFDANFLVKFAKSNKITQRKCYNMTIGQIKKKSDRLTKSIPDAWHNLFRGLLI